MDEMPVEDLWSNREKLFNPGKRDNLLVLYEVYPEIVRSISEGKTYTDDEIVQTDFFQKYLRRTRATSMKDPLPYRYKKHYIGKFRHFEECVKSIMKDGILEPLKMVTIISRRPYIYEGHKRIIIAHVLGIKSVKVIHITDGNRVPFRRVGNSIG